MSIFEDKKTQSESTREELIAELETRKAQHARSKRKLTPGIAMIAIFMLIYGVMNAIAAANGMFPGKTANYAVLAICSMMVTGVFGMLALRRWGWALVLGAAFIAFTLYLWRGMQTHEPRVFILAFMFLVFFLYLIRPEVRNRMR
jgi:hypothetical protein